LSVGHLSHHHYLSILSVYVNGLLEKKAEKLDTRDVRTYNMVVLEEGKTRLIGGPRHGEELAEGFAKDVIILERIRELGCICDEWAHLVNWVDDHFVEIERDEYVLIRRDGDISYYGYVGTKSLIFPWSKMRASYV